VRAGSGRLQNFLVRLTNFGFTGVPGISSTAFISHFMLPPSSTQQAKSPVPWICCQLGARMHYAVPRLLHASGRLERFYTDIYAGQGGWPLLLKALPKKFCPSGIRRLLGRAAVGLPGKRIKSYPFFGLAYYARRKWAGNPEAMDRSHLRAGKIFGSKVVRDGFGKAGAVYAFNTAALEILSAARKQGLFTVLEQTIVPRLIEEALLAEAQTRYAGWEPERRPSAEAAALAQREREEWDQADMIVCGSEFVRDGIQRCGGPVARCVVVPYGVDSHFTPNIRERSGMPLRVLTVGQVGLRKGAGCALEVAKALRDIAEFRWVGPVSLMDGARTEMGRHVELTGAVARKDIMKHYDWADVFFLPSICEGSATVTYEALACGLPVVTTTNAGSTVCDGVNGFILPIYDISAMAGRLRQLHDDRAQLARLSRAAALHSRELSLAAYQERFLRLVSPPHAAEMK
jgi:glycosyltransferase involved in cell wall biosynthesis